MYVGRRANGEETMEVKSHLLKRACLCGLSFYIFKVGAVILLS